MGRSTKLLENFPNDLNGKVSHFRRHQAKTTGKDMMFWDFGILGFWVFGFL